MVRFNILTTTMITLLVLVHFSSSTIQGRMLLTLPDVNSTTRSINTARVEEEDAVRGREVMGSRPPRCQGRCAPCGGHCIAVQVPWVSVSNINYARGDQSSDYKPITWKCKCGTSLFNP